VVPSKLQDFGKKKKTRTSGKQYAKRKARYDKSQTRQAAGSDKINQINHQLDATISPVYYLTFIYSSRRFGRPHAHHQEPNNRSCSLRFYRWSVVVAVLLVVVGPVNLPNHDQQHCYHHAPKVKPEAATAVIELLMMGVRTPETS